MLRLVKIHLPAALVLLMNILQSAPNIVTPLPHLLPRTLACSPTSPFHCLHKGATILHGRQERYSKGIEGDIKKLIEQPLVLGSRCEAVRSHTCDQISKPCVLIG
jgi:hypothetical protein